jgi:Tol biopolymer transport system component
VELISINSAGTDSGNGVSTAGICFLNQQCVSADGRFVVFGSLASDLVTTDTNGAQDVFVRDRLLGTTTLISVNSAGTDSGNAASRFPILSADGTRVAFFSTATDLVTTPTVTTVVENVYVRDLAGGTTTLVSVNSTATDGGDLSSPGGVTSGCALGPWFSADGNRVAFTSNATDLVATDTNGFADVFVRDLTLGTTTLVSVNSAGTDSGNFGSICPSISSDGSLVAFKSVALDLVTTPTVTTFPVENLYVRDLTGGHDHADHAEQR